MSESEFHPQLPQDDQRPTADFVEQVKQVLEHLYDFSFLQSHPLTLHLTASEKDTTQPSAHSLRRTIMRAIELLHPGAAVPFRAPHARLYHLLHLHYVEGMTLFEVGRELGISRRQIYRDLRKAEESVAALLWEKYTPPPSTAAAPRSARELSSLQSEVEFLEPHPGPTDLCALLVRAHRSVESLATQRAIHFHLEIPPEPVIIWSEVAVAQQVLTSLLSYAVQHACAGTITLSLVTGSEQVDLAIHYRTEEGLLTEELSPVVRHLAQRLQWRLVQRSVAFNGVSQHAHIARGGPVVLVIDDNAGLVELLRHYLASQACQVVAARKGQEGLKLAESLRPDAILLDIMLPEMDGWEVLQTLRNRPRTASIPVVVCSVFNDPQLAYSLGASHFLSKPVTRNDILVALRKLNVARVPFSFP